MPHSPEVLIHGHAYQPLRKSPLFPEISTVSPNIDWNRRITDECYRPLAHEELYQKISFNAFGVLKMQLETSDPDTLAAMNRHTEHNEIGSPFTHQILPDMQEDEIRIAVGAGIHKYQTDHQTTKHPEVMWTPETAMDAKTARILAEIGYKAFFCRFDQVHVDGYHTTENVLTRIQTDRGPIVAIAADQGFTHELGFGDKSNADQFTDRVIHKNFTSGWNGPLIGITDAETFGHHDKFSDKFLDYLVHTVFPERGYRLITAKDLDWSRAVAGHLVERSAWSCPHGNLVRWSGDCRCTGPDNRWKQPFYDTFASMLSEVTALVRPHLGRDFVEVMSRELEPGLRNNGQHTTPMESLFAAYAWMFISRTSCATFYGSPWTSGGMAILQGYTSLSHLRLAGMRADADRLEAVYRQRLRSIHDPERWEFTCEDALNNMLDQQTANTLAPALLVSSD